MNNAESSVKNYFITMNVIHTNLLIPHNFYECVFAENSISFTSEEIKAKRSNVL